MQFLENEIALLIKCDEYERALIAGQTVIEIWMDNCSEEEKEALAVFLNNHSFIYRIKLSLQLQKLIYK